MTSYPPEPQPSTGAVARNLAGLLLLLLGVAGLLTAAWLTHPLLGVAATSVAVGAAGYWLATSEA